MKGKKVESSSSSSSSSEEEEDEDDDDDEQESSDDDQSSSSTSDLDEESIKLIKKVEKMIVRLNVKGVPIQIQDLVFTNQRNEQRKRGCYGCGEWGHFCGSLSKQAHTQDKEEGMQEQSPHNNKVMGWFFKWRRKPSQEARSQALIIKLFSCVPYGTR